MDEIEKVFKRFDSNGDSKISSSEHCDVLSALGSSPCLEELRRMMSELDSDGDGFIDLKEFVDFHCGGSGGRQDHRDGDLKEAFELYDQDCDGLISASELHSVLKKLGQKCSLMDCSRMISSVDLDGDGKPGSQGRRGDDDLQDMAAELLMNLTITRKEGRFNSPINEGEPLTASERAENEQKL